MRSLRNSATNHSTLSSRMLVRTTPLPGLWHPPLPGPKNAALRASNNVFLRRRSRWLVALLPVWAAVLTLCALFALYVSRDHHSSRAVVTTIDSVLMYARHGRPAALCDALGRVDGGKSRRGPGANRDAARLTSVPGDVDHANTHSPLLVVALVADGGASDKHSQPANPACAQAAAAVDALRTTQTLSEHDRDAVQVAMVVVPGARSSSGSTTGRASARPPPCPNTLELPFLSKARISEFEYVAFVDVDFLARHRVALHPTVLEKMVLAATSDPRAAMITLHPSPSSPRASSTGSVCFDSSTPYVRRQTCHFGGSPLLVRVPRWLNPFEQEEWVGAVADVVGGRRRGDTDPSSSASSSLPAAVDLAAPLFCSAAAAAAVGNVPLAVRSLHELEHLVLRRDDGDMAGHLAVVSAGPLPNAAPSASWRRAMTSCADVVTSDGVSSSPERVAAPFYARPHAAAAAPVSSPKRPAARSITSHLTYIPPPLPGFMLVIPWLEHGGADQFNVNLARRLTQLGVQVVVVTTAKGSAHPIARSLYAITPDVFHLDQLTMASSSLTNDRASAVTLLAHLIATRNVQVVMISNSAYGYDLLPQLRAYVGDHTSNVVSFIDYVHLVEPEWGDGGYAAVSVASADHLDHTFAASKHVAEWMDRRRGRDDLEATGAQSPSSVRHRRHTTSVAYIGVDTRALRPLTDADRARVRADVLLALRHERKSAKNTKPVVLIAYVARMVDQKLPSIYFEIMRRLRVERRNADFVSVAIGDGDRLGELRANVSRLAVLRDTVLTYGMLDHDASMRLLGASDILLLPSRNEGVSLAVYEAMAMGVVPVVSAVGGQCELVTDGAGACISFSGANGEVPIATADQQRYTSTTTPFVDALERLITSPRLLERARRAARARCARLHRR